MKHTMTLLKLILTNIIKAINKILAYLENTKPMEIIIIEYNKSGKFLKYILTNPNLKSHREILKSLYYTLIEDSKFKQFGENKIIIVMAYIYGREYPFHHNILINSKTTFEDYYNQVKDSIRRNYDTGYPVDIIPKFKVLVWNMDEFANKRIKITKNANNITKFELFDKNGVQVRKFHSSITQFKGKKI